MTILKCFSDMALNLYIYDQILLIILVVVFLFEWRRTGEASEMYAYITALFAARTYENMYAIYARYLTIHDTSAWDTFRETIYWETRLLPVAICLTVILVAICRRIGIRRKFEFKKRDEENRHEHRRKEIL